MAASSGRMVARDQPAIAEWLAGLSHDSPVERHNDDCVWAEAGLALVPILISLVQDPDPEVRRRVIAALATFGEQAQRTLPVLRAALKNAALRDSDESVRRHAVHAVLQVGPQPASDVAALMDSLQDELEIVRFHAALALGDLGRAAEPAVPGLIHAAVWDEDAAVRVAAALALKRIDRGGPLAIHTLTEALGSDNELVCWIAADELGQLGPQAREAVPALQNALRRPFKMALVARGVALALQRIEPRAVADVTLPK